MPPIALSHGAGSGPTTSRAVAGPTFALTPEDRFAEYDPTRGRLLEGRAAGRATRRPRTRVTSIVGWFGGTRDRLRATIPVPE